MEDLTRELVHRFGTLISANFFMKRGSFMQVRMIDSNSEMRLAHANPWREVILNWDEGTVIVYYGDFNAQDGAHGSFDEFNGHLGDPHILTKIMSIIGHSNLRGRYVGHQVICGQAEG